MAWMADKLHFSVGYFGDLIKKETGQTAQQYIQNKIIDLAKQELLGSDLPVSEIAFGWALSTRSTSPGCSRRWQGNLRPNID